MGTAQLSDSMLALILDQTTTINFSELRYYYIYDGKNGIVFTLGFNSGRKFKLVANNNFCNAESFKILLNDFQTQVEEYKVQHQANIRHLYSIFARKQNVYLLTILTLFTIAGLYFTQMPVISLPIGASFSLLIGWIRYFQLRSKGQLTDI